MEFDEFFDAFGDGESSVETSAPDEQPETEATQEPTQEQETASEEALVPDSTEESTEEPADGESEQEETQQEQQEKTTEETFTVNVGGEERQLSQEEARSYAEKGMLYDDLQSRMDSAIQERDSALETLGQYQEVMDILAPIAEKIGTDTAALARQFYINVRKGEGVSEHEAAMELDFAQLKKQVSAVKPAQKEENREEAGSDRANREYAEFQRMFPGVSLNDDLANKLRGDVQNGMSLSNAYQKMLNEQKAAELAEQERKMKAANQNRMNRLSSPGSQQDSGGRREKSGFDDFFSQFH